MARIINGTLFISGYTPTGNPDEYTFSGATYDNQTDQTGNGAYDLATGFILYIPAQDPITAMPVLGVFNRYILTSLNVIDPYTVDGTILWDETTARYDEPLPSYCIISEPTPNKKYGLPSAVGLYYNLGAGADISSLSADIRKISDAISGGGDFFDADCETGVQVLDTVYLNSSNLIDRANASTITTTPVIGFVISKSTSTNCRVQYKGILEGLSLTENQEYYLDIADGVITSIIPTASGNVVQKLGYSISTTKLILNISNTYVVRS